MRTMSYRKESFKFWRSATFISSLQPQNISVIRKEPPNHNNTYHTPESKGSVNIKMIDTLNTHPKKYNVVIMYINLTSKLFNIII